MPANTDLTEAQVREFFSSLSNWGKWGPNDQLGALNYITPQKRQRAAAEVREGVSVTMSLPLATQPGPDNPTPVMHLMMQTGASGETSMVPVPYSADYFAIAPHGLANTHLDALCHVFNQGKMYNGYPSSDVTAQGAKNGAIDALKEGIVCMDRQHELRIAAWQYIAGAVSAHHSDLAGMQPRQTRRAESGHAFFERIPGTFRFQSRMASCTHEQHISLFHTEPTILFGGFKVSGRNGLARL